MADKKTKAKAKTSPAPVRHDAALTDDDLYLFNEGNHYRLYHKLGADVLTKPEAAGTTLPCGPRTRRRSGSPATLTAGTKAATP